MSRSSGPHRVDASVDEPTSPELAPVWSRLSELLEDVYSHSGFGEIRIAVRWLSKGRKEVILSCGKEYRFVVEAKASRGAHSALGERRGTTEE